MLYLILKSKYNIKKILIDNIKHTFKSFHTWKVLRNFFKSIKDGIIWSMHMRKSVAL